MVIAVNVADPPDQEEYPASEADASLNLNRNTSYLSYTGNETRDGIAKVRSRNGEERQSPTSIFGVLQGSDLFQTRSILMYHFLCFLLREFF